MTEDEMEHNPQREIIRRFTEFVVKENICHKLV